MLNLAKIYRPITAAPFRCDNSYCEAAPCDALKPYIRCFWGTKTPAASAPDAPLYDVVIPDTCMDLIFDVNYTQNGYQAGFCVVDEQSYRSSKDTGSDLTAVFAIRFYAWSAILFSDYDFKGRSFFSAEEFSKGLKAELEPLLFDIPTLQGKIRLAEHFLLRRLNENRINNTLLNSIYFMINTCGRTKISEVCGYASASEKQLERLFAYNTGVSPKTFSSLIRYQLLWQDMILSPDYNALDAVEKFGYTDQAHLLNDFRKRHLMPPKEAIKYAMSGFYNTNLT